MDLIELCADPDQAQIPADRFNRFMEAIVEQGSSPSIDKAFISYINRTYFSSGFKPSFDLMLQMCGSQSVGITDVLLRPTEAASAPLFPEWKSVRSIRLLISNPSAADPLLAVLLDGHWFRALGYTPSPSALARAVGLPAYCFDDLSGEGGVSYQSLAKCRSWKFSEISDFLLSRSVRKFSNAIANSTVLQCSQSLPNIHWFRSVPDAIALQTLFLASLRISVRLQNVEADMTEIELEFRRHAEIIVSKEHLDNIFSQAQSLRHRFE